LLPRNAYRIKKKETRNKKAKRREYQSEKDNDKEPEPGAVHCLHLLMFRIQE